MATSSRRYAARSARQRPDRCSRPAAAGAGDRVVASAPTAAASRPARRPRRARRAAPASRRGVRPGARPAVPRHAEQRQQPARSSLLVDERGAQLVAVRGATRPASAARARVRIGGAAQRGDHGRGAVVDRRVAPPSHQRSGGWRSSAAAARRRRTTAGRQPLRRRRRVRGGLGHRDPARAPGIGRASAADGARGAQLGGERGADRGRVGDRLGACDVRHAARRRHRTPGRARRRRTPRRTVPRPRRCRRATAIGALDDRGRGRSRPSCGGVRAAQAAHDLRRRLDVELHAPGQPAEPERLLLARRRAGQLHRSGRQRGDRVEVPLDDVRRDRQRAEQRVGRRGGALGDQLRAELRAVRVRRRPGRRWPRPAAGAPRQTPSVGTSSRDRGAQQCAHRRQPRRGVVVGAPIAAAEHDQRRRARLSVGAAAASPASGVAHVERRARRRPASRRAGRPGRSGRAGSTSSRERTRRS